MWGTDGETGLERPSFDKRVSNTVKSHFILLYKTLQKRVISLDQCGDQCYRLNMNRNLVLGALGAHGLS